MNPKFCPRCGKPMRPGRKFCVHCGFRVQNQSQPQPQRPRYQPAPSFSPRVTVQKAPRHLGFLKVVVALIAFVIGFWGYNNFSGNSNHNIIGQSAVSSGAIENTLNATYDDAKDQANGSSDSGSSNYYVNGPANHDYGVLKAWAKDMYKDENINSVGIHVNKIKHLHKLSNGLVSVAYPVQYIFHTSGKTHYQTFMWHAKLKKVNGQWKIVTNKANNHPISNHD